MTLISFLRQDPWSTAQFFMRSITIICSIGFFLTGFGISPELAYRLYLNVMMSSFFTFSIRLFVRMKESQVYVMSRAFLHLFANEDSGHYMLYTFFCYNLPPVTIFLIPVFLYAVLFTAKFLGKLMEFMPGFIQSSINIVLRGVANKQADIHRFIAYCEIFGLFIITLKVFMDGVFFLSPFLYYQFLKWRYMSRRNHSVKTVLSELKHSTQSLAYHQKCPATVSRLMLKLVDIISGLSPTPPPN